VIRFLIRKSIDDRSRSERNVTAPFSQQVIHQISTGVLDNHEHASIRQARHRAREKSGTSAAAARGRDFSHQPSSGNHRRRSVTTHMQPQKNGNGSRAHESIRQGDPCIIVIFGASGDLTKRKLGPALYNLAKDGLLPDSLAVVGFARREISDQSFRETMHQEVTEHAGGALDESVWKWLEQRLYYQRGDLEAAGDYASLEKTLADLEARHQTQGNILFYLATAPDLFAPVVRQLEGRGLVAETGGRFFRRVIVEKPFGRDLASARELNSELRRALQEKQIYRIDHYLGKETVQNLLVFRFSNGIFEPIWNRRYVDHVQITVAETIGVEGRGGYYDRSGALRDMVPNHIFQLISLVAMEPPISFEADAVRDEQSKVLRAVSPMTPEQVLRDAVRGQYAAGHNGDSSLTDYRREPQVNPRSNTETFVAMKLDIDNWRWKGVPFYLRVGKGLPRRQSEIMVQFRRPPYSLFRNTPVDKLEPNQLVINVQPDEGISLTFGAKTPGATMQIGRVAMRFNYADYFGREPATGYERLLYDALLGDQTLFQRADTVEAGWSVVTPVLDVWQALTARDFPNYKAGSWGPASAQELLTRDGREWRDAEGAGDA
jgi:glucose-6-phosphate 1-dehydrogenase